MAIIFEKVPASGQRCLILESGESLVYPFNISDWEEIRVAVALSLTNSYQLNGAIQNETISDINRYDYIKNLYIGIKSNNEFYPNSQKCSYIGIGSYSEMGPYYSSYGYNINIQVNTGAYVNITNTFPIIMPSGSANVPSSTYNQDILLPDEFYQSGSGLYFCNLFFLKIKIKDKGRPNQSYYFAIENHDRDIANDYSLPVYSTQFPSLEQMRKFLSNADFPSFDTGYFTSNLTSSGIPSPIPDAFYISNPFISNRIRIHGILIEKYA
jgi:hypothetical protein